MHQARKSYHEKARDLFFFSCCLSSNDAAAIIHVKSTFDKSRRTRCSCQLQPKCFSWTQEKPKVTSKFHKHHINFLAKRLNKNWFLKLV